MRTSPAPSSDAKHLVWLSGWVGVAAACLAAGVAALADTLGSTDGRLGPTAGGLLVLAALVQVGLLSAARDRLPQIASRSWARRFDLSAWLLVGVSVSLAGSLIFVARGERLWVFLAGVALVLTAQETWLARRTLPNPMSRRSQVAHRLAMGLGAAALAIWAGEGLLRVHDRLAVRTLDDAYALRATSLAETLASTPLSFHAGGRESPRRAAGERRRVVLLGNQAALQRADAAALLDELAQRFPRVDWTCRGVIDAGPREYALLAESQPDIQPPDLLLVCVSAATDQLRAAPAADWLEPRSWKIYQAAALACDRVPRTASPAPLGSDERLAHELDALRACRLAPDPQVESAWRESRHAVARLVDDCQPRGIDVALVVLPEAFQADPLRWKRLVDCTELPADAFDARLPQHRWTTLAVDLGVPVVDLTTSGGASRPAALATSRLATSRLAVWLDHRWGGTSSAPSSAVVARQ